jgi:hypothetical protein
LPHCGVKADEELAPSSRQDLPHHLPVHIREPEVAPLEAEGQALVVEAEFAEGS